MIRARAPGKLYVAGEYAVLEPGEPAVLVAVDRFVSVTLSPGGDRLISGSTGHDPLPFTRDRDGVPEQSERGGYALAALRAVEQLRAEWGIPPRPVDIRIASELDAEDGVKYGLGSSAAVTAAVQSAALRLYGLEVSREQRFRLALIATLERAPLASGGDVAASIYGGWIRYDSPDRARVHECRQLNGVRAALDDPGWDRSGVTPLPSPPHLALLVGWTGNPADSTELVQKVLANRPAGTWSPFLRESRTLVESLTASLGGAEPPEEVAALRDLLNRLARQTGVALETEGLRDLCDVARTHGATAKLSGAGGGDCGIALHGRGADPSTIVRGWQSAGITPLHLDVSRTGAAVDEQ